MTASKKKGAIILVGLAVVLITIISVLVFFLRPVNNQQQEERTTVEGNDNKVINYATEEWSLLHIEDLKSNQRTSLFIDFIGFGSLAIIIGYFLFYKRFIKRHKKRERQEQIEKLADQVFEIRAALLKTGHLQPKRRKFKFSSKKEKKNRKQKREKVSSDQEDEIEQYEN